MALAMAFGRRIRAVSEAERLKSGERTMREFPVRYVREGCRKSGSSRGKSGDEGSGQSWGPAVGAKEGNEGEGMAA